MCFRARNQIPFGLNCAFLLLVLAIFSWGLQAKLALYQPVTPSTSLMVAKLSIKNHSKAPLDDAHAIDNGEGQHVSFAQVPARPSCAASVLRRRQTTISLWEPVRYYLKGDYSLHLPPPALS
jgi:hypothetical protein